MAGKPGTFGRDFGKAKSKRSTGKKLSLHQEQDLEAEIAIELADKYKVWVDSVAGLGLPFSSGHENNNYLSEDGRYVYKVNNLMNSRTIGNLFKSIDLHNIVFPLTRYEFVGFTGNRKRLSSINPIFRQKLVDYAELAEPPDIKAYMESLGFIQTTPVDFVNDNYHVGDLYPRNVLKDANGTIYVVDAGLNAIRQNNADDTLESKKK